MNLTPLQCLYNYTVVFTVGNITLVETMPVLLTDEEIDNGLLEIPPSTLLSGLEDFPPGVTVTVRVYVVDEDGEGVSGSSNIPGGRCVCVCVCVCVF